ncbi:hypothetical protein OIU84_001278 [Salix udensis]|uniref:Uncharacterized protein n=1 Tax=Salix udensis TaxID=889485 RepID=A0AAD6K900_9ROSI|nr:hypothetical protein OIU84_001278 [Salix udensis]
MLSRQTSFPSSIYRAKGLRSLLIANSGHPWLGVALPDVIKQLTCIRSLNLSGSSIEKIPKEVGKLIHLRHLNLEGCRELVSLPETMCDLCNLQSLDVSKCSSLYELPRSIVKLIKLRHLRINASCVAFMPKGIKRLTCLRTLDCFIMCGGGGENESKAANLRELKNLYHIGGSLKIKNLQRGGIEDAVEAQLKNKKRLLCLELNFCVNYEDDSLIEVLEPSLDLERLCIYNYGGIVLPNWMMALTRLQHLNLIGCVNLEVLPPLGRLPNLESLMLYESQVRRLDDEFVCIEEVENAKINEGEIARVTAFPKLKTLRIASLSKLEEWDGIERRVGEEDATTTSIFIIMPQLHELFILGCPLLRALPYYVLAAPLQELSVQYCPNLRKRYGKEEKGEDWHMISHIPKIETGGNPGVIFKTHPNMNKELFANENILGLRDPTRPFPTGQTGDAGVGLLKWRMQSADESMVPLTINCWPSVSGNETFVSIEYEASSLFDLRNVMISVPLPALREPPSVRQIDGEWR